MGSAHLIWKLKIVPEISLPREKKKKNTFWYFECFTSGNPCDSSPLLKGNFQPGTPEKFSTLHLPWSLAVGGSSKVDKMSSTHPNSILLIGMSSMRQSKYMSKNPFWYFWFDRLWPFNFQLGYRPISSNHNILVCAHLIWKLLTERIHCEKPIFRFWVFHLWKSLWLLNFP